MGEKRLVTFPVGVNTEIVSHGINGFLAGDDQGWFDALRELSASRDMRRDMGKAGRARVVEHCSVQAQAPTVARVLREAAAGQR
jgi:hypothetical protein